MAWDPRPADGLVRVRGSRATSLGLILFLLKTDMVDQADDVFNNNLKEEKRFHYPILGEIIISKCAKEEIRNDLEMMGITPFTVYHDYTGLDAELRGKYLRK
jgi:hypothetical protein